MPITEAQRVARKQHVGSSDMAAVLGLSPWRSAQDVWLEKRGLLVDKPPSDVMNAGNWLEDGVLNYAEEQLGPLMRSPGARMVPGTPLAANTDALVCGEEMPVEAKTTALFSPLREWWGDDGTDQVPDRVIIQAHVHMMAWSKPLCHVPALIGGRGFSMYLVPRNDELADTIRERACQFWRCVETGEAPDNSKASLEVVKLVRRVTGKTVGIDPSLVEAWREAADVLKNAKTLADNAKATVLAALGDAEAGVAGEAGAVTYYEQTRAAFATKENTFRVLRYRKTGLAG